MTPLNAPVLCSLRIEHLFIAQGHRYIGRHGKEPLDFPPVEVATVECVAGMGIRGDRYFGHAADYKGQVTFFSMEVFELMCRALAVFDKSPSVLRRNVFVREADLGSLIGTLFSVQGVVFEGVEECRPCYWMDSAFATGADAFLKGRGGLRARIVADGVLASSAA